jgi:Fur family peroxide stress response transcriptional regulator
MNKISILNTNLKSLGLKATPQRLAILDFLDGNTSHPTAEDVYQALKPCYPSLSLTTVYNTLEVLQKAGKVVELTISPFRRHYDPDIVFHHHFFCRSCQRITDLTGDFSNPIHPKMPDGFKLEETILHCYGLCPECQKVKP